jgi:hypothetical protein
MQHHTSRRKKKGGGGEREEESRRREDMDEDFEDSDTIVVDSLERNRTTPRPPLALSSGAEAVRQVDSFDNEQLAQSESVHCDTFDQFRWMFSSEEKKKEEKKPEGDDEESERSGTDSDDLGSTMKEFRDLLMVCEGKDSATSESLNWDGAYCYLCSTVKDQNNDYRKKIMQLLEYRDQMDTFQMCHTIAQYYQTQIQPFTRKAWSAKAVEKHLSECSNDIPYTISSNLRVLAAYNRWYMKNAIRRDDDGNELPINANHTLSHLKIMEQQRKQIELYYRIKSRSAK